MKDFLAKLLKRFTKNQSGFTLAELIVVVAIIVGLAAVILPNVGRFTGEGQRGSLATERNSVQTALDAWAASADNTEGFPLLNTRYNHGASANESTPTNDFGSGSLIPLAIAGPQTQQVYLRLSGTGTSTRQHYCWDSNGTITWAGTAADLQDATPSVDLTSDCTAIVAAVNN